MIRDFFLKVRDERSGSVIIEFALLGPVMIAMLLFVLQVGLAMQSYNALRGISAEVARYAVINYQTNNKLSNSQLQDFGVAIASKAPFDLQANSVEVAVIDATTQRVSGAKELTVTVDYQVPLIVPLFGFDAPSIDFSRPVFLIDS